MRAKSVSRRDSEAGTEGSAAGSPGERSKRDELNYLADMIKELASMAAKLGCPTLAGILTLASREAQLERNRNQSME